MKSEWSEVEEYDASSLQLLEPELWEKLRETRILEGAAQIATPELVYARGLLNIGDVPNEKV